MYNFGSGIVTLKPPGTTPTPIPVGTIQEVGFEASRDIKRLYGNKAYPVAIALAEGKVGGKFKSGELQGSLISAIMTGASVTAGRVKHISESAAIPGTPYKITITNDPVVEDLSVYDLNTGLQMVRVASSPASGEYILDESTGEYTFAAADTTHTVLISYAYTDSSSGSTISYANPIMGDQTTFGLTMFSKFNNKFLGIRVYAAVLSKISTSFKNNDFSMNDSDWEGFAQDGTGLVFDVFTEDVLPVT